MPDYKIKLWNERNFPNMESKYLQEMYKQEKWAFVSDYMRFWVLYNEGGIYLDTDMEVLRPLDDLLSNDTFFGRADDGFVQTAIIGATRQSGFIGRVLAKYDSDTSFSTKFTSPIIVTDVYNTNTDSVRVYNSEVLYPCNDGELCDAGRLENAYTNHLWAESWVRFAKVRKFARRVGLMSLLKTLLRINRQ
jgi:mannosyltransferase OCH1-like enzyme